MTFWQTLLEDVVYVALVVAIIYVSWLFINKEILIPMDFDFDEFIKKLKGEV